MDIDYSTPATAIHDLKENFLNTRMGRPFARKRDRKAAVQMKMDSLNGRMPAGIQSVIDNINNFHQINI